MTKPCILAFVCAACVVDVGGASAPPQPPGEPDPMQTCDDPRYGDGACHTELSCAVPDLDCFRTFPDDASAARWFVEREAAKPVEERRTVVPTSDPRFAQLRAMLDTSWQAFSKRRPVGRLVEHHLAIVVVDDPSVNAFVTAESATRKEVFSVMVHAGLLAAPFGEDGRIGILLHELQHVVGMHGIPGVDDEMQLHYIASGGEPIGRYQVDDPAVRAAMQSWMNLASEIGPYADGRLGGFPYKGLLWGLLDKLVDDGVRIDREKCEPAAQQIGSLRDALSAARDPLDESITIDATMANRVTMALGTLRDQCMAGVSLTFVNALADLLDDTPQAVTSSMTASDLQLVTGKHVVNAIASLVTDRRSKMRTLEMALPRDAPWTSARYFTDEEDADDIAVTVLRAMGRDPGGYAAALETSVAKRGGDGAARCAAILDAGEVPPYGVDLLDTHHAGCWRAYHALQIAEVNVRKAQASPVALDAGAIFVGLPKPRPPELVIHH